MVFAWHRCPQAAPHLQLLLVVNCQTQLSAGGCRALWLCGAEHCWLEAGPALMCVLLPRLDWMINLEAFSNLDGSVTSAFGFSEVHSNLWTAEELQ